MKNILLIFLVISFNTKANNNHFTKSFQKDSLGKKQTQQDKILERLLNNPKSDSIKTKDITGLSYKVGEAKSIPKEFEKIAQIQNWDANSMTYEEMENEANLYNKEKYINIFYIGVGIISLLFSMLLIRKLLK